MQLLPRRDEVAVGAHVLPHAGADNGSLHLDLSGSGVGVDLGEDLERRCELVVPEKVARGLREDSEEAKLKNLRGRIESRAEEEWEGTHGRCGADCHHYAPALARIIEDLSKGGDISSVQESGEERRGEQRTRSTMYAKTCPRVTERWR